MCGSHALNNLLQGPYFSAIELMEIARTLDEKELGMLDDEGRDSMQRDAMEAFSKGQQNYSGRISGNVSDEGNFSSQVLMEALAAFGLSMKPIDSEEALLTNPRRDPQQEQAFILNLNEHWFAIRRFGGAAGFPVTYWNLNSTQSGPEFISEMYLSLFLDQLRREGYSIFVIRGDLPQCTADICDLTPFTSRAAAAAAGGGRQQQQGQGRSSFGSQQQSEEELLAKAIAESLRGQGGSAARQPSSHQADNIDVDLLDEEDPELMAALAASLAESGPEKPGVTTVVLPLPVQAPAVQQQQQQQQPKQEEVPEDPRARRERAAAAAEARFKAMANPPS